MMWVAFAAAAIAAAGLIGAGVRAGGGPSERGEHSRSIKGLSGDELDSLLTRLKVDEAPEPTLGAMCYDMAMPARVTEYVCPECGEKTLYEEWCWLLQELPRSRALFEAVRDSLDISVALDETMLCSHCAPGAEQAYLVLETVSAEGDTVRNEISQNDLVMLLSFLQGSLYYEDDFGGTFPLQPKAERIAQLLGLEPAE
jgi:hypothetical protein